MSQWIKMSFGGLILDEAWQTLEVNKSLKSDPPHDEQYEGKVHGGLYAMRSTWIKLFSTEEAACAGCVQEARRWYRDHVLLCQQALERLPS